MTGQLNLRINKEIIHELEKLAEETNLDRAVLAKKILIEGIQREKLNLIIQKYIHKEISIERASEISGLSLYELLEIFSKLGIPSNLSIEDIQKILK
jgi:predicted HTH domain antitoxin